MPRIGMRYPRYVDLYVASCLESSAARRPAGRASILALVRRALAALRGCAR